MGCGVRMFYSLHLILAEAGNVTEVTEEKGCLRGVQSNTVNAKVCARQVVDISGGA